MVFSSILKFFYVKVYFVYFRQSWRMLWSETVVYTLEVWHMLCWLQAYHAELHQYKQQVELFNQLTQKLIAVYQDDDTSRIKKATEQINQRYNNLNSR